MFETACRDILQKAYSLIVKANSVQREGEDLNDVIRNGDKDYSSNLVSDFPVGREELYEIVYDDVEFIILHQDVMQT